MTSKHLSYETMGSGPAIIFVHGWGGSKESLRKLAELAAETHQSIILDLPGFGESENPDPDWGVGEYAACVKELLEKLSISSCTYFGHSFGGSLGIYLASENEPVITKLILCNSSFKRRKVASSRYLKLKEVGEKVIPFFPAIKKYFLMTFYRIFFPRSDISKYPHLETNFRKIVTHDLSVRVEKITVPTLILWGEDDTATPIELAHELHKGIKNSQLKVFPGIGHGLPLKIPEEVWREVKKTLPLLS